MVVYCSSVLKAQAFRSELCLTALQSPEPKAWVQGQSYETKFGTGILDIHTPIWLALWLNTSEICIPKAPPNILWSRVWVQVRVRHPINVTCLPNWGTLTECFDIGNMPLKWNIWKARGVWTLTECFDIGNIPLKWNIWKVRGFVNCVIEVP